MKTVGNSRVSDLGRFFEIGCALGQKLPLIRHEEGRKAGTASRSIAAPMIRSGKASCSNADFLLSYFPGFLVS